MSARRGEPSPFTYAVFAVTVLAILVFLAWFFHFLGWGLRADSVNREGQVNRSSYGFQQARRDEFDHEISEINAINVQIAGATGDQRQQLAAQRWAIVNQACGTARDIIDLPAGDDAAFVVQNCQGGTGRPRTQYAPTR